MDSRHITDPIKNKGGPAHPTGPKCVSHIIGIWKP